MPYQNTFLIQYKIQIVFIFNHQFNFELIPIQFELLNKNMIDFQNPKTLYLEFEQILKFNTKKIIQTKKYLYAIKLVASS